MTSNWRGWYDSMVMTAYLGFVLYEISVEFRTLWERIIAWLKPMPRVHLSARLERELREMLRE